ADADGDRVPRALSPVGPGPGPAGDPPPPSAHAVRRMPGAGASEDVRSHASLVVQLTCRRVRGSRPAYLASRNRAMAAARVTTSARRQAGAGHGPATPAPAAGLP